MRNMKLKAVIAVAVIGSALLVQAATVTWDGGAGDNQWYSASNWDGTPEAVPVINGTDDAVINGAAVTYAAGGDMNWDNGSSLTLNGASLTQTTTHHTRYQHGAYFGLINSTLNFANAGHTEIIGQGTGSQTFTINNSTWSAKLFIANDNRIFDLTNGSTVNLAGGKTELQNGSRFDVTGSTLNLKDIYLNQYGGGFTLINVNNGAQVNLNATGLATVTDVITKVGSSMVNFAADSTGEIFIDGITQADLETMIGQSKFGVDGTISTTLADYTYSVSGSGVTMAIPEPATLGMVIAFGGSMLFIRRKLMM